MSNMERFKSSRADGRTDAQVLSDIVLAAKPGDTFTFADLARELSKDSARVFDRQSVISCVARCYTPVLERTQRTLRSIRGVGYKVTHAGEHSEIARDKKRRSDRQLRKGLKALQNVRWEEMDPNQRMAHEGQLLIISALYSQQAAQARRMSRVEQAVQRLTQRSEGKDEEPPAIGIVAG